MPDDPYKRAAELLLSITEAQKKLGQLNVESPFESVTVGDAGWSLDERLRRAVMGTHYERPIKTLLKYTLPFITEKPASTRPGVELNITSDEVRELMGGSMPGLPTGLYGAMAEGAEGEFEQRFANLYKVNIYRQYAKKHGLKERDVIIPSIPQFHGLMWALDQTSRPWRAGVTGAWHALRWRQLVVDDAVKNGMDPSTELRRRRNDIAKVSWDAAVRGLRGKEFVNVAEVLEMMPPVVSDVLSMGTVQSSMSGGGVFQGRGMGMPLTPEQRQLQYQIAGTIGEFGDPSMWMPLSWLTKPGALAGRLTRLNKLAAGIKEMKSYKDTAYRTMELARTVGVERGTGIPAMDVVWNMRVDRFDYLKGTGVARADRIVKEVAKLPEELQPMPVLLSENKDLPDVFTWIRGIHETIQPEVDALVATGKAKPDLTSVVLPQVAMQILYPQKDVQGIRKVLQNPDAIAKLIKTAKPEDLDRVEVVTNELRRLLDGSRDLGNASYMRIPTLGDQIVHAQTKMEKTLGNILSKAIAKDLSAEKGPGRQLSEALGETASKNLIEMATTKEARHLLIKGLAKAKQDELDALTELKRMRLGLHVGDPVLTIINEGDKTFRGKYFNKAIEDWILKMSLSDIGDEIAAPGIVPRNSADQSARIAIQAYLHMADGDFSGKVAEMADNVASIHLTPAYMHHMAGPEYTAALRREGGSSFSQAGKGINPNVASYLERKWVDRKGIPYSFEESEKIIKDGGTWITQPRVDPGNSFEELWTNLEGAQREPLHKQYGLVKELLNKLSVKYFKGKPLPTEATAWDYDARVILEDMIGNQFPKSLSAFEYVLEGLRLFGRQPPNEKKALDAVNRLAGEYTGYGTEYLGKEKVLDAIRLLSGTVEDYLPELGKKARSVVKEAENAVAGGDYAGAARALAKLAKRTHKQNISTLREAEVYVAQIETAQSALRALRALKKRFDPSRAAAEVQEAGEAIIAGDYLAARKALEKARRRTRVSMKDAEELDQEEVEARNALAEIASEALRHIRRKVARNDLIEKYRAEAQAAGTKFEKDAAELRAMHEELQIAAEAAKGKPAAAAAAAAPPAAQAPAVQQAGGPLRFDPSTNKHNGIKMRPGDALASKDGRVFMLNRDHGFSLEVSDLDSPNKSYSISVDPTDKDRYYEVFHSGLNFYDEADRIGSVSYSDLAKQMKKTISGMDLGGTAPTAAAKAPAAGARVAPAKLTKDIKSEPGYVYHATNEERLGEIIDSGKLEPHRPDYGTDQDIWPDGSDELRSYFTRRADTAHQFAPEDGKPVVIRTKESGGLKTESTGDVFSNSDIPTSELEYLGTDGKWHRLTGEAPTPPGRHIPTTGFEESVYEAQKILQKPTLAGVETVPARDMEDFIAMKLHSMEGRVPRPEAFVADDLFSRMLEAPLHQADRNKGAWVQLKDLAKREGTGWSRILNRGADWKLLGDIWIHPEIANRMLKSHERMLHVPWGERGGPFNILKILDAPKRYLIGQNLPPSPAFWMRNFGGGERIVFNETDFYTNPVKAVKYQRMLAKVFALQRAAIANDVDALMAMKFHLPYHDLTINGRQAVDMLLRNGIANHRFLGSELGSDYMQQLAKSVKSWKGYVPFTNNWIPVTGGAAAARFLEEAQSARLFFSLLEDGKPIAGSAKRTRGLLGDYRMATYTPFENELVTRLFWWYRWDRHNLPLQLRTYAAGGTRRMKQIAPYAAHKLFIEEKEQPEYVEEGEPPIPRLSRYMSATHPAPWMPEYQKLMQGLSYGYDEKTGQTKTLLMGGLDPVADLGIFVPSEPADMLGMRNLARFAVSRIGPAFMIVPEMGSGVSFASWRSMEGRQTEAFGQLIPSTAANIAFKWRTIRDLNALDPFRMWHRKLGETTAGPISEQAPWQERYSRALLGLTTSRYRPEEAIIAFNRQRLGTEYAGMTIEARRLGMLGPRIPKAEKRKIGKPGVLGSDLPDTTGMDPIQKMLMEAIENINKKYANEPPK